MKSLLKAGEYSVVLYHNIFTGSKTIYHDGKLVLDTPSVFWETSSNYDFEVNNIRYNLETIIYWYGGCEYKITKKDMRSHDCLLLEDYNL